MPVLVRFEGASFSFEGRPPLLEQLDFQLVRGWTGVVGENGAGKTTLLRLIHGGLRPTSGVVRRLPAAAQVVWCEQAPDAPPPAVQALVEGADPGPRGWEWLGRLEVDPSMVD